ncbi:MAG: alpha/beta hydrolase-fold protein [Planctomycetota bacterium]
MQYIDQQTAATKHVFHWYSNELDIETQVVRWGSFGVPLLLFPTAGGDAEEVERFYLIKKLEPFIHDGRLKVYSVDSLNGRAWMTSDSIAHRVWTQQQFDKFVSGPVASVIRNDCNNENIEIMVAGASVGAFNALVSVCRHPHIFSRAICMSGTYDLEKWLEGKWFDEFHHQSPIHFVPGLPEGDQLNKLRERFVLLTTGQGENEAPDESWKVAHALGEKAIPNRVDLWDPDWPHDWQTWREMLPKYVQEMLEGLGG